MLEQPVVKTEKSSRVFRSSRWGKRIFEARRTKRISEDPLPTHAYFFVRNANDPSAVGRTPGPSLPPPTEDCSGLKLTRLLNNCSESPSRQLMEVRSWL